MKSIPGPVLRMLAGSSLLLAGCATEPGGEAAAGASTFEQVRPVLEGSCVHCHGPQRLAGMPSFASTGDLAALSGPGRLIVPGSPEQSRFFQVVTMTDSDAGAMPPTGHALAPREVATLRNWILAGAPVPEAEIRLKPHGQSPRSR